MERRAVVNRKTRETDIALELSLDGSGKYEIDTGIGFFDHMLSGFARHGFFDLKLKVTRRSRRWTAITQSRTLELSSEKRSPRLWETRPELSVMVISCSRWTSALVLSAVDLCGRPYLSWDAEFTVPRLGDMDTEMAKEFFYARFLRRGHESPPEGLDTGQQSSYDGSNV